MNRPFHLLCLTALLTTSPVTAAVLSTNPPSQPLTAERISTLPKDQQAVWTDYLNRSKKQREADQEFLRREMRAHNVKQVLSPTENRSKNWAPTDKSSEWYRSFEARHTADCIVSFQTPAGGWSKNMSMNGQPRSPGMLFARENASRFEGAADFDAPLDRNWNYVGTFDNDATITQLRFLAKVISSDTNHTSQYLTSFQHGIDYIAAAQYPNGGWPQVWPLSGGYHDAITFNDNAMINILTLLYEVSIGTNEFNFASRDLQNLAEKSYQRGMSCLLASQVVTDGRRTIWPQQCDMLTLKPCSARNFEMPSLASGESANIVLFLMRLPKPSPEVVAAVHSAVAWFEKTQVHDVAFKSTGSDGRHLTSVPGNGPIWARYYELGTDKPLFGDRDKTIHDTVDEISKERRAGYSWYGDGGKRVLQHYKRWSKEHPKP